MPAKYNPGKLSADEIRRVVNHTDGGLPFDSSYVVLDRDTMRPLDAPDGTDEDRSGMRGKVQACQVHMNNQKDGTRWCEVALKPDPTMIFDPEAHYLQIYRDWRDPGTGKVLLHMPLMVAHCTVPSKTIDPAVATMWKPMAGDDLSFPAARTPFQNTYVLQPGTNVVDASIAIWGISYLPTSFGGTGQTPAGCPTGGPNIPADRVLCPANEATLVVPHAFEDTDLILGSVLNPLMQSILYFPWWFDEEGRPISGPMPLWTDTPLVSSWRFSTAPQATGDGPIKPTIERVIDQSQVRNVFKGKSNSPNRDPIVRTIANLDPASPTSLTNLKQFSLQVIQNDLVPDVETMDAVLLAARAMARLTSDTLSFNTVGDVVAFLQTHDASDIYVQTAGLRTVVKGANGTYDVREDPGPVEIDSGSFPYPILSWDVDLFTNEARLVYARPILT